eukprot:gb/GECG01005777.1/.p1 GENE.gb/GECG01005777.1/~~gb/GECG01005777.1/.p1  ORF type:complete len:359 (+),score=56.28 gb/GECG01005777.1/:1-1077(+)
MERHLFGSGFAVGRQLLRSARAGRKTLCTVCMSTAPGNDEPNKKVGFIGLGKMGSAMAANLLEAGYELTVYDQNDSAVSALVDKGARAEVSSAAVAQETQRVVSMLPNDKALMQECGTEDTQGILSSLRPGAVHISCSTVSPDTSRHLAELHNRRQASFVTSPVFARPDGIERKEAFFPISGKREGIELAKELIGTTSQNLYDFGEDAGAANVVKLCGNFLIGSAIESMGEALTLAEQNGLDRVQVMQMLNSTIFNCLIYKGYGQRVSERDHVPGGFSLELGAKDLSLVLDTAGKRNVSMPFGSVLRDRFLSAQAKGRADLDWSAIGMASSEDAGVDISNSLKQNLAAAEAAKKNNRK